MPKQPSPKTVVANALRTVLTPGQLVKLKTNVLEAKVPVITQPRYGEHFNGTAATIAVLANTTKLPKQPVTSNPSMDQMKTGEFQRPNRLQVATSYKLASADGFREALAQLTDKGVREAVKLATSEG